MKITLAGKWIVAPALILLAGSAAWCLTACGATINVHYPSGWPPRVGMSSDCREVEGSYVDPNVFGYVFDKRGVAIGRTGQVPAWDAFGFDPSLVRENEKTIKDRTVSISFDGKTLVLSYSMKGSVVLSKPVPGTKWSCTADGLKLTTINNPNAGFDKLPGHTARIRTSTLYRVGNQLIVKIADSSNGSLLYVLPSHDSSTSWFRFEVAP
ncbi:MAG TPA: hypothetical protein VIY68_16195 [Steroidobacteraceae bacterium]